MIPQGAFSPGLRLQNLAPYMRKTVVDDVVIGLPIRSYYEQTSRLPPCAKSMGSPCSSFPVLQSQAGPGERGRFDGDPLITLSTGQMDGWPIVLKRVLDITLSLLVLIFLAPLLLWLSQR